MHAGVRFTHKHEDKYANTFLDDFARIWNTQTFAFLCAFGCRCESLPWTGMPCYGVWIGSCRTCPPRWRRFRDPSGIVNLCQTCEWRAEENPPSKQSHQQATPEAQTKKKNYGAEDTAKLFWGILLHLAIRHPIYKRPLDKNSVVDPWAASGLNRVNVQYFSSKNPREKIEKICNTDRFRIF